MILSISYELHKPGQNYDDLYKTIMTAPSYCHVMTSHWFIRTDQSAKTWSDILCKKIDVNDNLFVVDITGQSRQGWLPKTVWEWLTANEYKKAYNY